ncbi:MAG: biotin/lipoyl-binding protein, partial [Corynebacterium sp.]|nr:biotin/lipoyl-binding protein [Corynebacterium sp.]
SDGEDDESSIAAALRTFTAQIDGRRHRITLPDGLANLGSMMQSGLGNLGEMGQEIGSRVRRSQPRRGSRRRGGAAAAGAAPVGESLTAEGALKSPMQAIVVRMGTEPGASVGEGDVVIVLEAMKMEKYIHAPAGGTVASIDVAVGQNVNAGDTLLHINAESTEEAAE